MKPVFQRRPDEWARPAVEISFVDSRSSLSPPRSERFEERKSVRSFPPPRVKAAPFANLRLGPVEVHRGSLRLPRWLAH